ncbi:MAG: MEDS domain-containing protein [Elusimicrobiota bacterium]|nr:MEDS domain-containing protein [Elusimicrobiota bacterium]
MKASLRESGSELLGPLPWGTHLCQFYESKQDLLDILVPYFAAGLKNSEFCMWITSAPLAPGEAERALSAAVPGYAEYKRRGRIEILRYDQWYTKSGRFDADAVLKGWLEKEAWALANGYEGLRVTGNTSWLDDQNLSAFLDYERTADSVVGGHRMLVVCAYSLEKCALPDIIEVIDAHEFALVKNRGAWRKVAGGRRKTEEALRKSCQDLEVETKLLADKNIAFREVINEIETEKNRLKDEIAINVNEIILPIVKRIKLKGGASRKQLDLLGKSLGTLVSSFGRRLTETSLKLTPKEIEICNMIKSGLTTKEISGLINASSLTISKHRNNIRKKLGLASRGVNLTTFLQSLE